MPYIINKFDGSELTVLADGTINTTTNLKLVGRNYVGYGEVQNENFVFLLENFAGIEPPNLPIKGQTWFDSTSNIMNVWDGEKWSPIGTALLSNTPPLNVSAGSLWLKQPNNQLYVYDNTTWRFIGPEDAEGFGTTRAASTTLLDVDNIRHAVILMYVDGKVISIVSADTFIINSSNAVDGFTSVKAGVTMSATTEFKGNLDGIADRARQLNTSRLINGIAFNGTTDITVKAVTPYKLTAGTYLTGTAFDGSANLTWNVDATSLSVSGKIVVRDSNGDFAARRITADLQGNVTGNIVSTGTSSFNVATATEFIGPLSGNATSATRLQTSRLINGVSFNGTANITVPAAAETLTGTTINSTVTNSSLRTVGRLERLEVEDAGIIVGNSQNLKITIDNLGPVISSEIADKELRLSVVDATQSNNVALTRLISASRSVSLGGSNNPSLVPGTTNTTNIGHANIRWNTIFANELSGNAATSTLATRANNLAGGTQGSLPYQSSSNTTTMLPIGSTGQVLKVGSSGQLSWSFVNSITPGNYLIGSPYNTTGDSTWAVDATPLSVANKVVARDSLANFSANIITASLNGNASSASRLTPGRTINGVLFDGTQNIEISDPNSGTPVGAILYYPSTNIPNGWLKCNGDTVSKTTYPLLFSKLGYAYGGSGDNFRLPDLRGEFIRGWDDGRGVDVGRALGSLQTDMFKSHKHGITLSQEQGGSHDPWGFPQVDWSGPNVYHGPEQPDGSISYRDGLGNPLWSSGGVETRPRNVALIACIKAFGEIDDPQQLLASTVISQINGKVNRIGDTMTGFLTLHANPVNPLHAATKQYVDASLTEAKAYIAFNGVTGTVIRSNNYQKQELAPIS